MLVERLRNAMPQRTLLSVRHATLRQDKGSTSLFAAGAIRPSDAHWSALPLEDWSACRTESNQGWSDTKSGEGNELLI